MDGTTMGLDIAKSVFQVHGCDKNGKAVIRKQLKRNHVPFMVKGFRLAEIARWAKRHVNPGRTAISDGFGQSGKSLYLAT